MRSRWIGGNLGAPAALEAGARRFAMALGRALECALLVGHAAWAAETGHADAPRLAAAARRLAIDGVDSVHDGGDLAADAKLSRRGRRRADRAPARLDTLRV